MDFPVLCGLDTEYGLYVEGRGAADQIDDAEALVRSTPGECFEHWDYAHETPRADLRGFRVERLAIDPRDAQYDLGRQPRDDVRADRILPNGARFYNDHGHPEYAIPECSSPWDAARADLEGEAICLAAAKAFGAQCGREVRLYKNNTDFNGASYGCHESVLVPRAVGWEALVRGLTPLLIARQIVCGAGKVGAETGSAATYQLSQRADFFVEPFNTETLYRRPIFNLRDEPHADPSKWIRLHVICGDANMIPSATALKLALLILGVRLVARGEAPHWAIADPVPAFQSVSRDETFTWRIELDGSWTTAEHILESYAAAGERHFAGEAWWEAFGAESVAHMRALLESFRGDRSLHTRHVDWAAKLALLDEVRESSGIDWRDPALRSYDLEYANIDPETGLYAALAMMARVGPDPRYSEDAPDGTAPTRAALRGYAVRHFRDQLLAAGWRTLTFRVGDEARSVELPVEWNRRLNDEDAPDVESFIRQIQGTPS